MSNGAVNHFERQTRPQALTDKKTKESPEELPILTIIKVALAADFARHQNNWNAKGLIQQLKKKLPPPSVPLTRATSQSESRTPRIPLSQSQKKPTQKCQTSKPKATPKPLTPKKRTVSPAKPVPLPKSSKEMKVEVAVKEVSTKLKKKIQKIPEVKKDSTKKRHEQCLIETAEVSWGQMQKKEKNKIRRLLLLRQVVDWSRQGETRRQGRDLRPIH